MQNSNNTSVEFDFYNLIPGLPYRYVRIKDKIYTPTTPNTDGISKTHLVILLEHMDLGNYFGPKQLTQEFLAENDIDVGYILTKGEESKVFLQNDFGCVATNIEFNSQQKLGTIRCLEVSYGVEAKMFPQQEIREGRNYCDSATFHEN